MSVSSEVKRVLLDAADLIERDGWCQLASMDNEGRRCVGQAFCDTGTDYDAACDALVGALTAEGFDGDEIAWNDAPGRTQAEVVAKLREVAAS